MFAAAGTATRSPAFSGALRRYLNGAVDSLLGGEQERRNDFTQPPREEALVPATSVSWRILKNPIALYVGGTAAVLLELAEPSVRAGVWQHSSFRSDPLTRMRRTGLAAMISVYGARSIAEPMIARVVQMHASVRGTTPAGIPYSANDQQLLNWVHATAAFGFAEAYGRYVKTLREEVFDDFYREGAPVSRLYGVTQAPQSRREMQALFASMRPRLEPSPIIFEFLHIMRETRTFPNSLRWIQPILLRAAVDLIPDWLRECLGLTEFYGSRAHERRLTHWAGAAADRIVLPASPAVQSCLRLGLPSNYLYR
jgi:uncharacterized protein (DUF2236 family)